MQPDTSFRSGSASAVITPVLGASLAGYFTNRKATGVLDDLYASALVVEKNADKLVLVACDLIGWPGDTAQLIRGEIARRLGIELAAVMITATHTHTGPVMQAEAGGQGSVDPTYQRWLGEQMVAVVLEANNRLAPAALEYGAGVEERHAFNRRYVMKNGAVLTNPGADNPDVVRPAGPADHNMQVIKVVDASRKILAAVVNFANHPDTTGGTLISADWPGWLRRTIQAQVGEGVPVLVLNGAAGDINHFDVLGHHVTKSPEEARLIGTDYGRTVLEILHRTQPLRVDGLGARSLLAPTPYRRISSDELAAAQHTVDELANDPEAVLQGDLDAQDIVRGSKAVRLMFASSIVNAARDLTGRTLPLEITLLRLGGLALVGINGEVFTEIGMAIKQKSLFEHTLVTELANGSIGYLGTKKAYSQGGYETMLGGRVCDEAEDYILRAVSQGMRSLTSK
jgi:neutral ceramidase